MKTRPKSTEGSHPCRAPVMGLSRRRSGQFLLSSSVTVNVGTGVPGSSGGLRLCHSVARSYAAASASTRASENRGPAIMRPTGSPADVKPQGTETAGIPYTLNWPVFSNSGLRILSLSSRLMATSTLRGVRRRVGSATTSKSANASSMVLLNNSSFHRLRM